MAWPCLGFALGLSTIAFYSARSRSRKRSQSIAAMQQIGYHQGLYERSDDWCSVAYWYQLRAVTKVPPLGRSTLTFLPFRSLMPRTDFDAITYISSL